jgi:hypothetical protein
LKAGVEIADSPREAKRNKVGEKNDYHQVRIAVAPCGAEADRAAVDVGWPTDVEEQEA